MLSVNLNSMHKWKVDKDNIRYYDSIMRTHGKVFSLDYTPYTELLNEFNIFYTLRSNHV